MKIIINLLAIILGYHFGGFGGAILALILVSIISSAVTFQKWKGSFHFVSPARAQSAFFNATFSVMGYIAKSDGHVSEREIQMARLIMERLGVTAEGKQRAISAFTQGKQADFDLNATLQALKANCHYPHLLKLFIEIQVQAAYAEGHLSKEKAACLQDIAARLNCPPIDFAAIEAAMRGQAYSSSSSSGQSYQRRSDNLTLDEAYRILEVTASATDAEIKKAYRKLMSQNHPDKLIAKGLPEAMIKVATEKTQQIQKAYEQIKQYRGIT